MMVMKIKRDEAVSLIKMLKALDNHIRYTIVEYMLNSPPVSRTDIHNLVEEAVRGITSKGTISFHLDILMAGKVIEKTKENEYTLYHVTPETVKTLEYHGLIEREADA